MAEKKKRVAIDTSKLEVDLESDELRELLDVAPDLWETMPDSQKLLLLSKRGLAAARRRLRGEEDE